MGPGVDLPISEEYGIKQDDPTITSRSYYKQPYSQRGTISRALRFTPAPEREADINGGGLVLPIDFETLVSKIDRGQQGVFIPNYRTLAGVVDPNLVTRNAIFGTMS